MKKYRLSTRGAIVDACSGKSGGIGGVRRPVMHNAQCTMHKSRVAGTTPTGCPRSCRIVGTYRFIAALCIVHCVITAPPLPSPQDEHARHQRQHGRESRCSDEPHDREAVAGALRVVVEAIEEQLVDRRPDPLIGRLEHGKPHVARAVLDAVEVPRQLAAWRQHHEPADVGVLVDARVVRIPEPDSLRQRRDRLLVPGQEVPALPGARAVVPLAGRPSSSLPPAPASPSDRSSR